MPLTSAVFFHPSTPVTCASDCIAGLKKENPLLTASSLSPHRLSEERMTAFSADAACRMTKSATAAGNYNHTMSLCVCSALPQHFVWHVSACESHTCMLFDFRNVPSTCARCTERMTRSPPKSQSVFDPARPCTQFPLWIPPIMLCSSVHNYLYSNVVRNADGH